jgi:hypothetical protein
MPYQGQAAGKLGHGAIVQDPATARFLEACDFVRPPSEAEANEIAASFTPVPQGSRAVPRKVIAVDASPYSEPIRGHFPSTQIGYVKLSIVLVDMQSYLDLSRPGTHFVDPFKAAEMHRNADALIFALPGSNVLYKGQPTVQDGFRLAVWEQLSDARSSMSNSGRYTIADTLFAISNGHIEIKSCPSCKFEPEERLSFSVAHPVRSCPHPECGIDVYATDTLRLHEQISDFGNNTESMTRFMNVIEHLAIANLIRMLAAEQPTLLADMAFFVDGPLAIFGQPAHASLKLMQFYQRTALDLKRRGLGAPVILGIQKEGKVMDHARSIARFIPNATFRAVDDTYRKKHISANSSKTDNFGDETYYGQDFILKTRSGKVFVIAVPYPFADKNDKPAFAAKKVDLANYPQLGGTFGIVQELEMDLYPNAVVPTTLAHRHASIGLVPGGKVLDLMSRNGLLGPDTGV